MIGRRLLFLAFGLACVGAAAQPDEPSLAELPTLEVKLETATGAHAVTAWVAADDASRRRGLMYVRELSPDQGMLFLFPRPLYASFWMKNTFIPLDLAFIGIDGRVVNLATDTRPLSLEPIVSTDLVLAVLELPAGSARRLALVPGDRVSYPAHSKPK